MATTGLYPKEGKTQMYTKTCIGMFTAMLLMVAKSRSLPTVPMPIRDESINNVTYPCNESSNKREQRTNRCDHTDKIWKRCTKKSQAQERPHVLWLHLYQISRIGKSIGKVDQCCLGSGRHKNRKWLLWGTRFLFMAMNVFWN